MKLSWVQKFGDEGEVAAIATPVLPNFQILESHRLDDMAPACYIRYAGPSRGNAGSNPSMLSWMESGEPDPSVQGKADVA